MENYICPLCDKIFYQKVGLKNHLNRKTMCTTLTSDNEAILNVYLKSNNIKIGDRYKCTYCPKEFTREASLKLHLTRCKVLKPKIKAPKQPSLRTLLNQLVKDVSATQQTVSETQQVVSETRQEVTQTRQETQDKIVAIQNSMPQQISKLLETEAHKLKPNNLMVHIGNNEDFYQKLEALMGGPDKELEVLNYIVDCALSDRNGAGSSKLVKKIYIMGLNRPVNQAPVFSWHDSKSTLIKFRNQDGDWQIEGKNAFSERLTTYLEQCYTKTFQKLEQYKEDHGKYPCEWGTYQLTTWNEMNAMRAQPKFGRNLLNQLAIPKASEIRIFQPGEFFNSPIPTKSETINPVPETPNPIPKLQPKTSALAQLQSRSQVNQDLEADEEEELEEDRPEPIQDYRRLVGIAPPSEYIPGAPPELVRMRYVSPNTIDIKTLIRNPLKKPKPTSDIPSTDINTIS